MEALPRRVAAAELHEPMAMCCWALSRATTSIRTLGLCHGVQGTAEQLAADIGVPLGEIDYAAAGINHMAFCLRFARAWRDSTRGSGG